MNWLLWPIKLSKIYIPQLCCKILSKFWSFLWWLYYLHSHYIETNLETDSIFSSRDSLRHGRYPASRGPQLLGPLHLDPRRRERPPLRLRHQLPSEQGHRSRAAAATVSRAGGEAEVYLCSGNLLRRTINSSPVPKWNSLNFSLAVLL